MSSNMGGTVQVNIKAIAVSLAAGGIALYLAYGWYNGGQKDIDKEEAVIQSGVETGGKTWKTSDFGDIPKEIADKLDSINIIERTIDLEANGEKYKIFIREAGQEYKEKVNFLLLHGMAFTSKNWVDTKTIHLIAALGHRVIAVDLPGHGDETSSKKHEKIASDQTKTAQFMEALIKSENLQKPVIVSPSMSGSFAIPFIMGPEPDTCDQRLHGYIPVAPAATSQYNDADYKKCKIPVMIVYGSKDKSLGETSYESLKNFPNAERFIVQDAGHPCYIDQPEVWRRLVHNYIKQVL